MAFLLPLAEVGAFIAGGVAEGAAAVGVGSGTAAAIGSSVGGAAVGYIGTKANNGVQTAVGIAVQQVTGKSLDQWQTDINYNMNNNYGQANKFFNGSGIGPTVKNARGYNPGINGVPSLKNSVPNNNDALANTLNSQLYTKAITTIQNSIAQQSIVTADSPLVNIPEGMNTSSYLTPTDNKPIITNDINGSIGLSTDVFQKLFDKSSQYPVTAGFTENNLQNIPPPMKIDKDQGYKLGCILGKTIVGDSDNTMTTEVIKDPSSSQIVKSFLGFIATAPTSDATKDPEYDAIYRVFNGFNCSAFINNQGQFCFLNEIGQTEIYSGPAAPLNSDGSQLSVVQTIMAGFTPTLYGTWTGPNSPNNMLPVSINSVTQSSGILDLYSLAHDISYQDGWFHKRGDLAYISRVKQNIGRMSYKEKAIGIFAIKWFTQVSYLLGNIKGSLGLNASQTSPDGNPNSQVENPPSMQDLSSIDYGDLFTYITKGGDTTSAISSLFSRGPSVPTTLDHTQRDEFYSGLFNGLNQVYAESIKSVVSDSGTNNASGIPSIFNYIEVVDLSD